jgi:hypothetical protein
LELEHEKKNQRFGPKMEPHTKNSGMQKSWWKVDLLVQMDKLTLATNTNMEIFFVKNQKNMENFQ